MAEAHLVYKLEGSVSEIDVFKLAPTLLALGDLIQASNREIFPQGRDIGINVKPFREGSFVVDLTVFSPSNIHKLIEFLTPHSLEQLKTLLECIGLIAGGGYGAVQAIRKLGRQPKSIEPVGPDEYRYTTKEGNSFTINSRVHSLLSRLPIVRGIRNVYVPPMTAQEDISDIKTYMEGHEQESVTVGRDDIQSIDRFSDEAEDQNQIEEVHDTVHHGVLLNPKRGAFGNDPKDWSFWRGNGIITANIKDKSFLSEVASGQKRLNESDLLTVDLLEHQRLRGTTIQKSTYDIVKVTDYKQGAIQSKLLI